MAKPVNASVKILAVDKQTCAFNAIITIYPIDILETNWFLELFVCGSILQISSVKFSVSLRSIYISKYVTCLTIGWHDLEIAGAPHLWKHFYQAGDGAAVSAEKTVVAARKFHPVTGRNDCNLREIVIMLINSRSRNLPIEFTILPIE
jgi:hypothetical protein